MSREKHSSSGYSPCWLYFSTGTDIPAPRSAPLLEAERDCRNIGDFPSLLSGWGTSAFLSLDREKEYDIILPLMVRRGALRKNYPGSSKNRFISFSCSRSVPTSMPTYDYQCEICGQKFEVFQNMSDPLLTECPQCKGHLRRLVAGGTGIIFKGPGFYVTDNPRTNRGRSKAKAKKYPDSISYCGENASCKKLSDG